MTAARVWTVFLVLSLFGFFNMSPPAAGQNMPELVLQVGHGSGGGGLAFAPDRSLVASGGNDGTILIVDPRSAKVLRRLQGPIESVGNIAFSPDGRWLASSAEPRPLVVGTGRAYQNAVMWDVRQGVLKQVLQGAVGPVAFMGDGENIISVDEKNVVRTWKTETGLPGQELLRCGQKVQSFATSGKSGWLALACGEGEIRVLRIPPELGTSSIAIGQQRTKSLSFSPDGSLLGWVSDVGQAKIIELSTGNTRFEVNSGVFALAFTNRGVRLLATSGRQVTIREVDSSPHDGTTDIDLQLVSEAAQIALSSDATSLAAADFDGNLEFWDISKPKLTSELPHGYSGSRAVTLSRDGKLIAIAGIDNTIVVWSIVLSRPLYVLRGYPNGVSNLSFSPDGTLLASTSGSLDNLFNLMKSVDQLLVWDMRTGGLAWKLDGHGLGPVAFSPDGRWLAVRDDAGVSFLNPLNGAYEYSFKLAGIQSMAFSSDSRWLATGSTDKKIRVWDVHAKNVVQSFDGASDVVMAVAFSPDSKILAAADQYVVNLWNTANGSRIASSIGHTDYVDSLAFSRDGTRLASASWDHSIKLWDSATGRFLKTLAAHTDRVYSVAFAPKGELLFSASTDGTTRIWNSATTEPQGAVISLEGGTDWIVISPSGLFHGTAGGIRGVGWRLPKSELVVGLDRFFNDYYYPGLLADIWEGRSPQPKASISQVLGYPGLSLMLERNLASVRKTPDGETYFCVNRSPAAIVESRGRPVTNAPELTIVHRKGDDTDLLPSYLPIAAEIIDPECEYKFLLPEGTEGAIWRGLQSGRNQPDLRTKDENDYISKFNSQPASRSSQAHVRTHVLAIGIDHYADVLHLTNLSHAVADATKFSSVFGGHSPLQDAKSYEIRKAFFEIKRDSKPEDEVILFMSGHGRVNAEEFTFLPADAYFNFDAEERYSADPDQVPIRGRWENVITAADLADFMQSVSARRVMVVIDACQAGGALEPLDRVAEAKVSTELRRLVTQSGRSQTALPQIGIAIIGASDPIRPAYQPNSFSPLLRAILDAVEPQAASHGLARDVSPAMQVQVQLLAESVSKRLPTLSTEDLKHFQTPLVVLRGVNFTIHLQPSN